MVKKWLSSLLDRGGQRVRQTPSEKSNSRSLPPAASGPDDGEPQDGGRTPVVPYAVARREPRYPVSDVYQRYISLKVRVKGSLVPVALRNFSAHGLLYESSISFDSGAGVECLIAMPELLSQEVAFRARVKHCQRQDGAFFVGIEVLPAADETWFRIFTAVHDFIVQRQGHVY